MLDTLNIQFCLKIKCFNVKYEIAKKKKKKRLEPRSHMLRAVTFSSVFRALRRLDGLRFRDAPLRELLGCRAVCGRRSTLSVLRCFSPQAPVFWQLSELNKRAGLLGSYGFVAVMMTV